MGKVKYTQEQINFVLNNYSIMSEKKLAEKSSLSQYFIRKILKAI
jgi:hypothetical protein